MVQALLLSYLGVAVLMILLWFWQARSGRGSIVDVFWTLGVTLIALVQLLLVQQADDGPNAHLLGLSHPSFHLQFGNLFIVRTVSARPMTAS